MESQTTGHQSDGQETTLLDLVLLFAENLRILVGLPLAAGLVALGIAFVMPETFIATARILPPSQQQSSAGMLAAQLGALAGLVGGGGGGGGFRSPSDQYAALLKSRTVSDALIERFQLRELYRERFVEATRKTLENNTRIAVGTKDNLISIEVQDREPKRAAAIANAYVEELRKLTNTLAVTESAQRRLFFENQLKQAKDNLAKAEVALRGSGVNEDTLKTVPQSALEALARLKAQITAQEIKIASMRSFMTESNPEFKLALQELGALRAALATAEQTNPAKPGSAGTEYIGKFRDFKYHEVLFDLMAKQYEVARLDEAREGAVIQVVDVAVPPDYKAKPKKALIAILTTLIVFFFTALYLLVRAALRRASRDSAFADKLARLRSLVRLRRAPIRRD